ncbi:MAG: hypothetical protein KJ052_16925 [Candidatus Hydrogenedentes bacterium]|nr:hypothetical protein [Candidatus Hydrogenedentota bacterium]
MKRLAPAICLACLTSQVAQASPPIVLDNGAIRVIVDPQVFAVTFIGVPGGSNFLLSQPLTEEEREGGGWVESGGLHTDLIPYVEGDEALRRGPAVVTLQEPDRVVMEGPASDARKVKLTKEAQLYPGQAKARFRVTAHAATDEPVVLALRNTIHLPASCTLRLEKAGGAIKVMSGADNLSPAVVSSMQYWLIPIPPTAEINKVVLGTTHATSEVQNIDGYWTRRLLTESTLEAAGGAEPRLLCLLDDETKSYVVSLQGPRTRATPEMPAHIEEVWSLKVRGSRVFKGE